VRTRKFLLMSVLLLFCSLAATLESVYFSYYVESNVVDLRILHRGWPLYWVVESIPLWDYSPPASRAILHYIQPMNFLVDIIFWLILFQLPSILYSYLREAKNAR
jgi:hypothetical protein